MEPNPGGRCILGACADEVHVNENEQIIHARRGDETAWIALKQRHQDAVRHPGVGRRGSHGCVR